MWKLKNSVSIFVIRWVCIYPAYINSKKTRQEGRILRKDLCVDNPTYQEIKDVLGVTNMRLIIENKLYPRERSKVCMKMIETINLLIVLPVTRNCCTVAVFVFNWKTTTALHFQKTTRHAIAFWFTLERLSHNWRADRTNQQVKLARPACRPLHHLHRVAKRRAEKASDVKFYFLFYKKLRLRFIDLRSDTWKYKLIADIWL